jgi:diguanylate cyclase (GGDEF)-like protein
LVRAGTPVEVSVLAVIALLLGIGCIAAAAFSMPANGPRALTTGIGAFGIVSASALLMLGPRVSRAAVHLVVITLTALRGLMVAAAVTERGLMLGALGFVWTAVYVAFFFRPSVARAYAWLLTAVLGVSLLLAHAPTDVSVWLTLSAMVWMSIVILAGLNTRLRADAETDSLTGLLNRTGFALAAGRQWAVSRRRQEPIAVAMIDLDGFKAVNDAYGHAAGDHLLARLGAAWSASLRPGDLLARFGGDEFVLLLPGVSARQLEPVLDRLRAAHPAAWTAGTVICTAHESVEDAIARADLELYAAKTAEVETQRARRPSNATLSIRST